MKTSASRGSWIIWLGVVAVVLTAAAGFCAFDTNGPHHHCAGLDLCATVLAVPLAAVSFVALGIVGMMAVRLGWAATPVAVSIPDPPPWR